FEHEAHCHVHLHAYGHLGHTAVLGLQDAAHELTADDLGLDQDLGVVLTGGFHRGDHGVGVGGVRDPADPDAASGAGRFDEHDLTEIGDVVEDLLAFVGPPAIGARDMVAGGDAVTDEDGFHEHLVHCRRAGKDPGARVPDSHHLEQTLDGAVLTE